MLYKEFQYIGQKLFLRGLNNSHSGNISVRKENKIFISRTGSMCDEITEHDVIEVDITPDEVRDKKASMELLVHRSIYNASSKVKAVVHAHAPYSIVMAEDVDQVKPYEQEGQYFFQSIPVLHAKTVIASPEVAEKISSYVNESHAVIVAKHGVFGWGATLEEAYHYLMVVESACRINYLLEVKRRATKNY